MRLPHRLLAGAAVCGLVLAFTPTAPAASTASAVEPVSLWTATEEWMWPVAGPRVVRTPYQAPPHPWSSGHRGIDIAPLLDTTVRSPASGVVAFRGTVVDRPLITIAHAGGLVTTLEPVASALHPGDTVRAGEDVGTLALGGHTPPGLLHVGVRWHGAYINPLLLLGGVPRAILLRCCDPLP